MIPLALVGCAHIHTPNFAKTLLKRTDVRVACVWDPDPARAARYGAELGAPVVADVGAIWADPAVKGAVICSETLDHPALVHAGAAAGKALFVEKPLGAGAKESRAMAEAIVKAGVLFQTGFFRRGAKASRTLKNLVARGALGTVTRVRDANMHHGLFAGWFDGEFRWMTDPKRAGVGAFGDMGAHSVDLLVWLLGEVESATGVVATVDGRYPGCDETGEAVLRFRNGAIGTVGAGWLDHGNPVSTQVSGTKGHAYIRDGELYLNHKEITGAEGFQPYSEFDAPLPHAFELFLDALAGGKDLPLVPVAEAAHGAAVVEAVYRGATERKWIDVA